MPLATGSGQSSATAAGRSAAVPRSGSASSSSTINRSRPVPVRRATPSASTSASTSNLANRSKAGTSQNSIGQSTSSPAASSSILATIPKPSFPPSDAFEQISVDNKLLPARLLQLARLYLKCNDNTRGELSNCDFQSACFYAYLALRIEPTSLAARRILASTLLHGAQLFPFGPSSVYSTTASTHNLDSNPSSSASISGAHVAIEVLKEGNEDVFLDIGCARIFAKACTILGKVKEGKEALAWTLKRSAESKRSRTSSSSSDLVDMDATTPRIDSENIEQAFLHCEMGNLAARGNRYDEARTHYLRGKKLDRWSWSSWTGLCDVGSEENISSSFCAETHHPKSFYATQLESRLLSHGYDAETVRKTIEELQGKGEDYFLAEEGGRRKEEEGLPSLQRLGSSNDAAATLRKTNGNGNLTAASTAALPKNFSRPGTRTETASTATAGTKRVRTTTSGSTTSIGTAPRLAPGASQNNKALATSATDSHISKRPAVSSISRGNSQQSAAVTKARSGGTLSAMRTNEQQRPNSSASGSSRGAIDKDIIKPRRSLRSNIAGLDEQQQEKQTEDIKTPANRGTAIATTVPLRRVVPKAAPSSTISGNTAKREDTMTRPPLAAESSNGRITNSIMQTASFEAAKQASLWNSIDREIKNLVQSLAMAYCAVRNHQSRSALILLRKRKALSNVEKSELKRELGRDLPMDSFIGLEDCFRNSVHVQCLIARAYHDLSKHHLAEKHFLHARRLSPTLDAHMDIFSLTLFHLHREVALSRLARELSQLDSNSCVSHIAKGNAFALQREHSLALQSFQRACIAGPHCAYAFTLAGYEAYELGFKERSLSYFRRAINIEKRHWNAFAGLAQIYYESEQLNSAAYYYSRAIAIHKTNPVLWDVYGSVSFAQGKLEEAEEAFERAIQLDKTLAMSHIKMAEVLLVQGQLDHPEQKEKAHQHLLEAVKYAPEEAHVHLMLAHTYMDKGRGSFARIDQGGKKKRNSEGNSEMPTLLPSELQQIGTNNLAGPSNTARALGNSTLPQKYQAEIAKHLCAAIDLDPKYVRYVKSMGEGAKAALRGVVSRFTMEGNGGPDGSTLLMDSSVMLEGQTINSVVDLDGDQVLEDHTALTEELESEGDEEEEEGMQEEGEEEGESDDDEEEQRDENEEDEEDNERVADELEASGSEGVEMLGATYEDSGDYEQDEMATPQRHHPIASSSRTTRRAIDESDVSMSF